MNGEKPDFLCVEIPAVVCFSTSFGASQMPSQVDAIDENEFFFLVL
jgi:hypothetical protein